jgi:hypothetical protein
MRKKAPRGSFEPRDAFEQPSPELIIDSIDALVFSQLYRVSPPISRFWSGHEAIKTETFRLIPLLSRHSLQKPNPRKERTLDRAV